MPGSSNTSFIPKHTPTKAERKSTPRQLFLGTLLVRILFFAVLIASVGTFAYDRRVTNQLATEVAAFKAATQFFEADEQRLQAVLNIDKRLMQANDRITKSASFLTILTNFEAATIQAAQINTLNITRESDSAIVADALIKTNTFDSVLFQRIQLQDNDVLKVVELKDVAIVNEDLPGGAVSGRVSGIDFNAIFEISPSMVSVVPRQTQPQVVAPEVVPLEVETATDTPTNQNPL